MATRYWVGGTNTWNATAGSKWESSYGAADSASVPTSADDVYIDARSSANTITLGTSVSCKSLNFVDSAGGAFSGTFAISNYTLSVYGDFKANSGMTMTSSSGTLSLRSTTSSSVTFNGIIPGGSTLLAFGTGGANGTYTVTDAINLNAGGYISLVSGTTTLQGNVTTTNGSEGISCTGTGAVTLNCGSGTFSIYRMIFSNTANKTVNLNSAQITMTGTGATITDFRGCSSFNGGTSRLTYTGASPTVYFNGNTLYDVYFQGGAGTITIQGSNQFRAFDITPSSGSKTVAITAGETQTITGSCTYNGTSWKYFNMSGAAPLPWVIP